MDNYQRLNFNVVRIHQEPASPYMLDVADEMGLMVIDETGIRGGAAFVTHDDVCQANKGLSAARRKSCTKIVCTAGTCTVKSRLDARSIQLRISQAVEIGALGVVQYNVTSVTLNDVAKGGSGGIVAGKTAAAATTFAGHSTIDQTISEQSPEPPPPAPP